MSSLEVEFFSSNVAKNKSKKIENLEKSQNTFFCCCLEEEEGHVSRNVMDPTWGKWIPTG